MYSLRELLDYLNKRGFDCEVIEEGNAAEKYTCKRDNRSLMVLKRRNNNVSIEYEGVEEELRDFVGEDKEGFREFVLEVQGIIADLKLLTLKGGMLLHDKLLPFLEELILEEEGEGEKSKG
uniref:Uncharacterized protein n=1 Tax=Fervidicoccus fontis TaxID=683846 RepID=A0A7J3ZM10_9CREN